MKTYPSGFTAEKNKKTGITPLWILKLTIGSNILYLSDNIFSIPSWQGGVTTKAWIKQCGDLTEGLSGHINEMRTTNIKIACINDKNIAQNLDYYLSNATPEKDPAELYQWFYGLNAAADPPQMFFRGYIREPYYPDDYNIDLEIEDESMKLQNYIGNKVTTADYPSADPDDVGKVKPIVYGTVKKLKALAIDAGAQTSLPSTISSGALNFFLSDTSRLAAGKVITIDSEEIYIRSLSGDTVTDCVRGYNNTLAVKHLKGAVAWEKKSSFVYLVADHAMDVIGKIYTKAGDAIMDITSVCTKYTGQAGNFHPLYPGKAVVTVPGYVTAAQAVDLLVNDGINVADGLSIGDYTVRDLLGIGDSTAINDTTAVVDAISVGDNISIATGAASKKVYPNNAAGGTNPGAAYDGNELSYASVGAGQTITIYFPNIDSGPISLQYFWAKLGTGTWSVGGGVSPSTISGLNSAGQWVRFQKAGGNWGDSISFYSAGGSTCYEVYKEVDYTPYVGKTGSAYRGGSAYKGGSVGKSGGAYRSGVVDQAAPAYRSGAIAKTGTATLYGNSVANTLVGDELLVDVTRNITLPDAVVQNALSTYCGVSTLQMIGTLPASYKFNGAITEYQPAIWWFNYWALQCRCYFRMHLGVGKLIFRPDALISVKSIPSPRLTDEDGRRILRRYKSPFEDIINKMHLLFDRDYSTGVRDSKSYQGVSKDTRQASIDNFGEREMPDLFMFDFITDQTMANNLRDYYLNYYSRRHWIYAFETFLDHSEFEMADGVTLGFLNNALCETSEVRFRPGDKSKQDTIELIVKEA